MCTSSYMYTYIYTHVYIYIHVYICILPSHVPTLFPRFLVLGDLRPEHGVVEGLAMQMLTLIDLPILIEHEYECQY